VEVRVKDEPIKVCIWSFGRAGQFLGFVVHENGIEIDPNKIETINKIKEPTNETEVQSLLGKVNYLRHFITNLARKLEPLLPLARLKHEKGFVWGAAQQEAFDQIKENLSKLPVLHAPKEGVAYRLYIAATDGTLGAVLMQELAGKEFSVAYLSRRMVDVETTYTHIEKLCLSLYYVCSKFRHYILSSSCVVTCQHDVVRHMIQKLILSGRMGKWANALVEYQSTYEPLRAVKRQIVAVFIIDHNIDIDDAVSLW
jgi:hypothetical protein